MKNPKILLSVIGGLTAVFALLLGWLIWSDCAERAEFADSLEGASGQADRLVRLPVRPCPAAIRAVESNATLYVGWRTNALASVSRGDRAFEPVTPPAFKTFLVSEARRLSSLPGAASGRLVKPDFPFGFRDYITGGVLPSKDDLPRLQREWSDISTVVELLATNGVGEILDVRLAAAAAAEPAAEADPKARAKARRKARKTADETAFRPDVTRFAVDFLARPEALVAAVNGLTAATRYVVVEDFSFAPEKDALVEELGGEEKKASAAPAGGRRGRRRAAAQAEAAKESGEGAAKKTGVIVDPATAAPLKVTMAVAVYDFKTAGAKASGGEEAK